MAAAKRKSSEKADESKNTSSSSKNGSKRRSAESSKSAKSKTTKAQPEKSGKAQTARSKQSETSKPRRSSSKKKKGGNAERTFVIIGVLVVAIVVTLCLLFSVDRVQSNAMLPTLAKDDIVLNWRFAKIDLNDPNYIGKIYKIDNADKQNENAPNYLRIIACGKNSVSYKNASLAINGRPLDRLRLSNEAIQRPKEEPEIWRESITDNASWHIMLPQVPIISQTTGTVELQNDECFMAGDNRMASYDSRKTGAFNMSTVHTKALFIIKSSRDDGIFGSYIKLL